jgi:hypothetical protein
MEALFERLHASSTLDHTAFDRAASLDPRADWDERVAARIRLVDYVGATHIPGWTAIDALLTQGAARFGLVCETAESHALREWQNTATPFLLAVKNAAVRVGGFWELFLPDDSGGKVYQPQHRMVVPACGPLTIEDMKAHFAACATPEGLGEVADTLASATVLRTAVHQQFRAHEAMIAATEDFFKAYVLLNAPVTRQHLHKDEPIDKALHIATHFPTRCKVRPDAAFWKLLVVGTLRRLLHTQQPIENEEEEETLLLECTGSVESAFGRLFAVLQREFLIELDNKVRNLSGVCVKARLKESTIAGTKREREVTPIPHRWQLCQAKVGKTTSGYVRNRVPLCEEFADSDSASLVLFETYDVERRKEYDKDFAALLAYLQEACATADPDDVSAWMHRTSSQDIAAQATTVATLRLEYVDAVEFTDKLLHAYAARQSNTLTKPMCKFLLKEDELVSKWTQQVGKWLGDPSRLTDLTTMTAKAKKELARVVAFLDEHLAHLRRLRREGAGKFFGLFSPQVLGDLRRYVRSRRSPLLNTRTLKVSMLRFDAMVACHRSLGIQADEWRKRVALQFVKAFWKACEWSGLIICDALGDIGFLPDTLTFEDQLEVLKETYALHGVSCGHSNRLHYQRFGESFVFCLLSIARRAGAVHCTSDPAEHAAFLKGTAEANRTHVFSVLDSPGKRHVGVSPLDTEASLEFATNNWACARMLFSQTALCVRLATGAEEWSPDVLPMFDVTRDSTVGFQHEAPFFVDRHVTDAAEKRFANIERDAKRCMPPTFGWQFHDVVNVPPDSEDFLFTTPRLKLLTFYSPEIVASDGGGLLKMPSSAPRRDRKSMFREFASNTHDHEYYSAKRQNVRLLTDIDFVHEAWVPIYDLVTLFQPSDDLVTNEQLFGKDDSDEEVDWEKP